MAFQDSAERLASKLHLAAIPRPLYGAVCLVAVIAVLVGAWGAMAPSGSYGVVLASQGGDSLQDGGEEGTPTQNVTSDGISDSDGDGATASDGEGEGTPSMVHVHVDGAVAAPGLYCLETGSRVDDAVRAAGGLAEGASSVSVNLAQVLEDGQQIVVPTEEEAQGGGVVAPPQPEQSSSSGGLVSINRATASELQALPGIGEATAEKIVADREANGPFASLEDLKRVSGIGDKKYEALKDGICL